MDYVKQDYYAVASVLEHTLNTMKLHIPFINEVFLRSDNAGCYHSGFLWSVLPDISRRTGTIIRAYDYSELQSGKSYCDSKIAHMRLKMRLYIAEKHNIVTASDMKVALDSKGGVAGCHVAVVEVNTRNHQTFTHKFKSVSQIHNILYSDNGDVTVWRAYGIGKGERIKGGNTPQLLKYKETQICMFLKILLHPTKLRVKSKKRIMVQEQSLERQTEMIEWKRLQHAVLKTLGCFLVQKKVA